MSSDCGQGDSPCSPHTESLKDGTDVYRYTGATMSHQPYSAVLTINTEVFEAYKCCTKMRHYKLTLVINYSLSIHQSSQRLMKKFY